MLVDPPIDKLINKIGCKYALVTVLTKRARYLMEKRADFLEDTGSHPVTLAAHEIFDGKIEVEDEE